MQKHGWSFGPRAHRANLFLIKNLQSSLSLLAVSTDILWPPQQFLTMRKNTGKYCLEDNIGRAKEITYYFYFTRGFFFQTQS